MKLSLAVVEPVESWFAEFVRAAAILFAFSAGSSWVQIALIVYELYGLTTSPHAKKHS